MRLPFITILSSILVFTSCIKKEKNSFSSLEEHILFFDSILNVRALEVTSDKVIAANSDGKIITISNDFIDIKQLASEEDSIAFPNLRALAVVEDEVFAMSIGNPALLFKNGNVVYKEYGDNVFYDAMVFWNASEGIAIGDPVDDCLSIVITRDRGETWQKVPCSKLPKIIKGEAAFAASNTNIKTLGNKCWIATGGISSRIFFSDDKGNSWKVFETPIVQGEETTGMYSLDFYNNTLGFALGGDYTKPMNNSKNKIKTIDGGKTWEIVGVSSSPGYRSCVQFVPESKGQQLVAVGFEGVDISNDAGLTWKHVSDASFYTIRFADKNTAYAAGRNKVSKLVFK